MEMRYVVSRGVHTALEAVRSRYEDAADMYMRLPFHNTRHTKSVVERVYIVGQRLVVSGDMSVHDLDIAMLAGAYHDTVQKWRPAVERFDATTRAWTECAERLSLTEEEKFSGLYRVMRKRFIGANELASADEAVAYMESVNRSCSPAVFSDMDMNLVREAIDVTVPGFDPTRKTVVQPRLTANSSVVARVVALADLLDAGMNSDEFVRAGKALFLEENLDVYNLLDRNDLASESHAYIASCRDRLLAWLGFQPVFAEGRRACFESEISAFSSCGQKSLMNITGYQTPLDTFFVSTDAACAEHVRIGLLTPTQALESLIVYKIP